MIRLPRRLFCLIFVCQFTFAASQGDVVINEIAWMGTVADFNDEWIELYNTTGSVIDLSDWVLQDTDGTPTILLSGLIPGHGYYLLERTSDNTIKDISADMIYSGAMSNSDENLELRDDSNILIDFVDSWYAGDNTTKSSMERICCGVLGTQASNWGTNDGLTINGLDAEDNPLNATPKSLNSVSESSLSVSLSEFSAAVIDESVVLNWATESEVNSAGFNIYRSVNKEGPFEKVNFETIPSKGNSSIREVYQYVDNKAYIETEYWYQLAEVDQNGVETFYGFIHVPVNKIDTVPEETGLLPNYPNPFNPSTSIVFRIGEEDHKASVQIDIVDVWGRIVREIYTGYLDPGQYTKFWDGVESQGFPAPSGMYFCRIRINHCTTDVRKIMKIQ